MMFSSKGESTYNVVVIGAGTAGLVTAAGTAGLGGRVALIERNKMGGDCLNFGCVPSKALISSARLIEKMRHAENWGLKKINPEFEFTEVMERMRAVRAQIAPHDSQERFESLGVDVFRGDARFRSPHEVEIGETVLRAKNIVIATGSRAAIPKIEGIEKIRYFTNETIFDELETKTREHDRDWWWADRLRTRTNFRPTRCARNDFATWSTTFTARRQRRGGFSRAASPQRRRVCN